MSDHRRPSRRRAAARVAAGLAGAVLAVLLGATAASAHVHVDGTDATRGGYGVLTFRVPTESATASTTEVVVTMPRDTPIASAAVQPIPGWTAKVTTVRLATPIRTDDGEVGTAVSRIDWKADDRAAAIAPGEFQQFVVSVGPLPDVAELVLPTLQRYSDGTTVDWNERAAGSAEPEHPAPVLALRAEGASPAPTATARAAATSSSSGDTPALAVGIVAVALAAVALVVAVIGLLRGRRHPA